jgi:hypothetical protein
MQYPNRSIDIIHGRGRSVFYPRSTLQQHWRVFDTVRWDLMDRMGW